MLLTSQVTVQEKEEKEVKENYKRKTWPPDDRKDTAAVTIHEKEVRSPSIPSIITTHLEEDKELDCYSGK